MTWESNDRWHLGRAREPYRLPGATASAEDRPWRLITALPTELVPRPCSPTRPPRQERGHALVIDGGWREVADTALAFVQRFT
jgi:hypothetical protein